jgi:copper chaperone CopZ
MRVPPWIVPLLVLLLALLGLGGSKLFAIPSVEIDFAAGQGRTVEMLVGGVKCVDTAQRAASALEDLPGIYRYVAFASRNRVEITYDPKRVAVEQLREALEGPIYNEDSGEFLFNVYEVIEIDGKPVSE